MNPSTSLHPIRRVVSRAARGCRFLSSTSSDGPVSREHVVWVSPWDGFKNAAYTFAVARELEKRLGPIEDITLYRDSERPTHSNYGWFRFKEPLPVVDGVFPPEFQRIKVKKPPVDLDRPGGVGLDDLTSLLKSKGRQNESEWARVLDAVQGTSESTYIDVKLNPSAGGKPRKRLPQFQKTVDVAELVPLLASFSGFAKEETLEMMAVQSKWKPMADQYAPPAASSPATFDPLAGYLDNVSASSSSTPHEQTPTSETISPAATPTHDLPLQSAVADEIPAVNMATVLAEAEPANTPSTHTPISSPQQTTSSSEAQRRPVPKTSKKMMKLAKARQAAFAAEQARFAQANQPDSPEPAKADEEQNIETAKGIFGIKVPFWSNR